jgi:hypothetical protein
MFIQCFLLSLEKNVQKVACLRVSKSLVRGPMPVYKCQDCVINLKFMFERIGYLLWIVSLLLSTLTLRGRGEPHWHLLCPDDPSTSYVNRMKIQVSNVYRTEFVTCDFRLHFYPYFIQPLLSILHISPPASPETCAPLLPPLCCLTCTEFFIRFAEFDIALTFLLISYAPDSYTELYFISVNGMQRCRGGHALSYIPPKHSFN